jgi:hypothetical protein
MTDGTKLRFGWEARVSIESKTLDSRSRTIRAKVEDVTLTAAEASLVQYARDEALSEMLEIGL